MNKTLLITGATGNLGSVVSSRLAHEGHQILATVTPGHPHPNNTFSFFECDLTSEQSVLQAFESMQEQYSRLDGVLMLAGGFDMGNIQTATSSEMLKMFELNYMTAFHISQCAINWMQKTGGGDLIFVGAKPALEGNAASMLPYAISKSAVIKLAEIINSDTAQTSVKASVIVPSIIDTPANRASISGARFSDWVTPETIAEAISFLLSTSAKAWRQSVLKIYGNS